MKRIIIATGLASLMALGASAQGHGRAQNMRGLPPPSPVRGSQSAAGVHSNAPRSSDRDKGRDRAEDVGKGHKKGLSKQHKAKR
jgi:hypothetical protein